jgi:coenzyme F420 hydrogenase subunit beta
VTGRIDAVLRAGLCVGCGACTTLGVVERPARMALSASGFLRPVFEGTLSDDEDQRAAALCPAVTLKLQPEAPVHAEWGPLVQVRTGWAADAEVRHRGSSGGALSALLVHLLESGRADFVAHIAVSADDPLTNTRRTSRTRADVLVGAGSRYAPAAAAIALHELFASGERFAFVGKPCDVAAMQAYVQARPALRPQLVLVASFMCAGVPSMAGTHDVLAALGTRADDVVQFQYRGNGWPGFATAQTRDGRALHMDYNRSWGQLLGPRLQLRCKLCPDGTGEFADVVCADAWYGKDGYPDFEERDGRSLILSRTPRGEALLLDAAASGAIVMEDGDVESIALMQPYQLTRKRVVLGRWLAVGLRTGVWPRFSGLHLRAALWRGGWLPALRNAWGTFKRVGRVNA